MMHRGFDKFVLNAVIDQAYERVVVAIQIHQANRLAMLAHLPLHQHFEQLLKCSKSTRERDERVATLRH